MRSKKLLSFVIQGTLENEHVLCFILLCAAKITFLFLVHFVKKKKNGFSLHLPCVWGMT